MEKVMLDEFTWPELRQFLDSGELDTVIIMIGSTEQHGPHLPVATDALVAETLGKELVRRLGKALLAPPIRVGCARHHMSFPGTISLEPETLGAIVKDYVMSLARHGFKNIVIVPTHGGNFGPVVALAGKLREMAPGVNIVAYTQFEKFIDVLISTAAEFGVSQGAAGGHADENETSMILAVRPDLVHMERAVAGYIGSTESIASTLFAQGMPALSPIGVLGDPRSATAEKGLVYLERLVDHLVDFVRSQI